MADENQSQEKDVIFGNAISVEQDFFGKPEEEEEEQNNSDNQNNQDDAHKRSTEQAGKNQEGGSEGKGTSGNKSEENEEKSGQDQKQQDQKQQDQKQQEQEGSQVDILSQLEDDSSASEEGKEEESESSSSSSAEESGDEDVDYNQLAKALVDNGVWDDFEIEGEDKTIDKEKFAELQKKQQEHQKQKIQEEALNELSQEEKDFIEYKKNGGDINQYLQNYNFKKQAENLDISTDQNKKSAVYSYYKNVIGWDDERIQKHIQRLEKDMELDDEAQLAKNEIEEKAKEQYNQKLKEQEEAKKQQEEQEKQYKENVQNKLNEKGFDKKTQNQIVRDLTDIDDNGLAEIDKKYLQMRNDPEWVDLVWHFATDPDTFMKKISQKQVNEEKRDEFIKIKNTKKGQESSKKKQDKEKSKEEKKEKANDSLIDE